MPTYQQYIMRHGEHGAQALIETIERNEGIRYPAPIPLEQRWKVIMRDAPSISYSMAA